MLRLGTPALLAIGLLALAPSQGQASCGAEDCPLDLHATHGSRFSFDLNYQFIHQDRIRVGSHAGSVGELPSPEDEVPGLKAVATSTLSLYGYAQIPVYQHVNRIQLVAPYHLMVGTTLALGW